MPRLVIACGLIAAVVLSPAAARGRKDAEDEPDLTGTYTVALGKTPKGDSYDGVVEIQQKTRVGGKHGTILWDVTWKISSAENPVHGIGVAVDSVFIVAYGPATDYGLAAYSPIGIGERQSWMLADDTIRGTWIESSGRTGTEGLRGAASPYHGRYRLHGATLGSDGYSNPYAGTLDITPHDDVLEMIWDGTYVKGRDKPFHYTGLGLEAPGIFVVGWGLGDGGGVGVYVIQDGKMVGMYTEHDGSGREDLVIPDEVVRRLDRGRVAAHD